MNVAERWIEGVVGYPIDWDATGTWVGGLGTMLAVTVAGGIALFQHWSNHDVARAAAELRWRRLAALCDLISFHARGLEYDASIRMFDLFAWAHLRADKQTWEPLARALEGVDLLDLPSGKAMGAFQDLVVCVREMIAAAEELVAKSREGTQPDRAEARERTERIAFRVVGFADQLKDSLVAKGELNRDQLPFELPTPPA